MKRFIFALLIVAVSSPLYAQFVATMKIEEPIEGICNEEKVYVMFPMLSTDQKEAECPLPKEEITNRINDEVSYLKEHPKFKGEGIVRLIINCKGEVVECVMDNKTKSTELDQQIVAVFNTLGDWKAGTLNGKKVDTARLFSFKIKRGKLRVN